ncbi:zinc protease [Mesorhizobium sp. Root157]|uniref:M16 family metallopeptidase n=1 Tax=Mesorhizobium sp. Root157 TaxID=1736477 RepID=UPI0006FE6DB9|nr:pitrilysin family protein [Mesorhizobium sp. Root157]KQZ99757.1 zinc protease [Mesorhizobium sp. Root157]
MTYLRLARKRLIFPSIVLFLSAFFLILPTLTARAAVTIQEVKSEKGITAWLVEDYSVPIIALRFVFDGGSTQDPDGKEGLANLMTGLFDEGAGDLDSDAFQERLDDAGAEMRISEGRDGISGAMRMLAEQKDEALDLLRLAIEKPRFDQAPIDRIRGQILAGITAGERDPNTAAETEWRRAVYGSHPYSRPSEGTKKSLATITADDLRAFHKATFARSGLHIAVVGAIDAKTLQRELDQLFGGLPEKQSLEQVLDADLKLGQQLQVTYDLPQTSIQMAFPGVKRSAPEFYAATLMNEILGGGTFTSRLFEEVREKRGLAYSIDSGLSNLEHASSLIVTTATRADRAIETLAVVRDAIKHTADEGPTEAELAAAKKYLVGAYAINNLDSSGAIASTLIGLQLNGLGIDYMDRRAGLIDSVTLDEVKAVAKRLLSVEPAVMVVGPALTDGSKG